MAFQVLNHHVRHAAGHDADVHHAGDVLAMNFCGGACLAPKALRDLAVRRCEGMKQLHGNALLEL